MASEGEKGYFWMGNNTHKVPYALHAENRQRLIARFVRGGAIPKQSFILLEGGKSETRYDTDCDRLFRQESFFQWTFGVMEPDCYGALDVDTGASVLFIPKLPAEYAVWLGAIQPPAFFKEKYNVDEVKFVEDLEEYFSNKKASTIYTLCGLNSDSGNKAKPAEFKGIEKFKVDQDKLFADIVACRVIKTPKEIEVIRYTNKVSSDGHKAVMKHIKAGMREYQLESVFLNHCYYEGGCRNPSYVCICATGFNGSVLHYGHSAAPNDHVIKDGDLCLFDMGAEYHCYCSDITCTFPANGVFTEDQKAIYNAVLEAQVNVEKALKPGSSWVDMHRLAERSILAGLLKVGILRNGTVDELLAANMGAIFMPHGLGHFLGLDTHDVGGYPENGPSRPAQPGVKKLRTARIMEEGMVVTVEPGLYFIDVLLDGALADATQSKFVDAGVLSRFRNFGGVRLEDDVVITADGCEVLTQVPRTVEDIEAYMKK